MLHIYSNKNGVGSNFFCIGVAFLVALHQNKQLIGSRGLLPVDSLMRNLRQRAGSTILDRLQIAPTLFWFVNGNVDVSLCKPL